MDGRAVLKSFFLTGEKPTQDQFADLIDSCFNLVDDTISIAQISGLSAALAGKAAAFTGSSTQYVKGNGTYATLGLSDITGALGYSPENVANKSISTSLGTSDTLYPSQNAVKTYVDTAIAGVSGGSESWASITGTPTTLAGYGISDALSASTATATYQPIGSYLTGITSAEINSALGFTPQAALSGTGFVKISGTMISYDNNTYLTTGSAAITYAPLASPAFTGTPSFTLGSDATGDIYYRNSSGVLARLGIGSTGQVLTVTSGLPSWTNAGAGVTSTSNTDGTLTISPTSGAVVASLNLGHANTWTVGQTISVAAAQLTLSSGSGSSLIFQAYGTNAGQLTISAGGFSIVGGNASTTVSVQYAFSAYSNGFSVSSTGTQIGPNMSGASGVFSALSVLPTANQSGTAGYNVIFANVTETATGSGAKYLELLQVGNVTKWQIDHLGNAAGTSIRGYAVTYANLPSSATTGMLVEVTDSTVNTWGSTIAGSGSYSVLAHYNGTNWTVAAI